MKEKRNRQIVLERIAQLREKRRKILALPPEKALERILQDPQPAALVHSFPESDFYFLIHDIGAEDALPLLSLASDKQWDHIIDLEAWQTDRIEVKSVTRWLNLLQEADPQRFLRWLLQDRLEFGEFYLFKNIELRIREHDQDPSQFGDGFFSLDNTYFVRFKPTAHENESSRLADVQRREFLTRFLRRLADFDHRVYQNVLLEATRLIPAEVEEESYRQRNVRLAEKGFLPFEEAVGVYQPVRPQDLAKQPPKFIPRPVDDLALMPVPLYPIRLLRQDNDFARALQAIEPATVLQQIQVEFAGLCNQIIVADHRRVTERQQLRTIVKKACGYLSIGLQRLSEKQKDTDRHHAAALLTSHPLNRVFAVGYGAALELKWRAEKWLKTCWFAAAGLRLTFWGEQWMGVLGGLLIKRPLYYDNYKTGVLYREFESLEDLRSTAAAFDQIQAVDELLSLMSIQPGPPSAYGFLTYKNLLLTLWARHWLGLEWQKPAPLTVAAFAPFFEALFADSRPAAADHPRRIPMQMKASFLNWLCASTGLKDYELTRRLGQTFEALFNEIETEYGRVAVKDLDFRYVQLFLLRAEV